MGDRILVGRLIRILTSMYRMRSWGPYWGLWRLVLRLMIGMSWGRYGVPQFHKFFCHQTHLFGQTLYVVVQR